MARGNHGGQMAETRAARVPVWALCREHTPEAVARAVRIMRESQSDAAVMSAVSFLVDRGWGKAPIVVVGDEARPVTVNIAVLPPEMRLGLESALRLALAEGVGQVIDATLAPSPGHEPGHDAHDGAALVDGVPDGSEHGER